mmetsp:Transcript_27023/g.62282  ORF Transcript_27023/g.62282 Transcript_27023/m.62282 type:complete len:324 (-) Transcript_27023:103-1074(-)
MIAVLIEQAHVSSVHQGAACHGPQRLLHPERLWVTEGIQHVQIRPGFRSVVGRLASERSCDVGRFEMQRPALFLISAVPPVPILCHPIHVHDTADLLGALEDCITRDRHGEPWGKRIHHGTTSSIHRHASTLNVAQSQRVQVVPEHAVVFDEVDIPGRVHPVDRIQIALCSRVAHIQAVPFFVPVAQVLSTCGEVPHRDRRSLHMAGGLLGRRWDTVHDMDSNFETHCVEFVCQWFKSDTAGSRRVLDHVDNHTPVFVNRCGSTSIRIPEFVNCHCVVSGRCQELTHFVRSLEDGCLVHSALKCVPRVPPFRWHLGNCLFGLC